MSNPESKAYKWWILGCLMMAVVAPKTYYVREMIAALAIFSALFGIVALLVLGFFALDRVRQRTFACARASAVWLVRRAATSSAAWPLYSVVGRAIFPPKTYGAREAFTRKIQIEKTDMLNHKLIDAEQSAKVKVVVKACLSSKGLSISATSGAKWATRTLW